MAAEAHAQNRGQRDADLALASQAIAIAMTASDPLVAQRALVLAIAMWVFARLPDGVRVQLRMLFTGWGWGGWCGPGRSGGPVHSELDCACRLHDQAYGGSVAIPDNAEQGRGS